MRVMSIVAGSLLTAGAAILGAGAAVAGVTAESTVAAAQEQANPQQDRSRRVCRTVVPSGSRLGVRTCRTQAEWDEQANAARNRMEEQNRTAFNEEAHRANRNMDGPNR